MHRAILLAGSRKPLARPPETLSPVGVVLEAVVAELATGRLVVGLAEALRTELRARASAAAAASQACDRKVEELGRAVRVARQEAITRELLETVAADPGGPGWGQ